MRTERRLQVCGNEFRAIQRNGVSELHEVVPVQVCDVGPAQIGWLLRSDQGLKPAEERELATWLAADPRHEAAFLAVEETWHRLGKAQPSHFPVATPAARRSRRWLLPVSFAAAAAVVFLAFAGWRTWQSDYAAYEISAQTELGGLRELDLPDGSVIRLNTDTEVAVSYSRGERRAALKKGEAHFTVAKNKARPFIVSAAGVDVRAVGTAFNVRLRAAAVDVMVTEGRVRLEEPSAPALAVPAELGKGERTSIALNQPVPVVPAVVTMAPAAMSQALAWQEKRLDFDGVPLGEMVEEINRYSQEKLVIEDAALRAERFSGAFPAGDTETVVRMLVQNFDVVAEKKGPDTILRWKSKDRP